MKIKYLTFECVSRCNMDCNFCFSNWRDKTREMSTEEIKRILKLMKDRVLEAINFTGGEPLLRDDITELLKFSKKLGLTTIISTNGILLKSKLGSIAKYTDFLGLPLDSINPDVHNGMRKTNAAVNHHKLVLELLDIINQKYPKIGIKINTIVTKKNKEDISQIGDLISGKVVSWKLSQFIPGAYGKSHEQEFKISPQEYLNISEECKKNNPKLNIISSVAYSRDSGCRVLSVNGDLLKPCKNSLKNLGNVLRIKENNLLSDFNEEINEYFLNKTYPKLK